MKKKLFNQGSERRFNRACTIFIILLCIFCLIPFVLVVSASITDEKMLTANGYQFLPSKVSWDAYVYLWTKRLTIFKCYFISVFVTFVGTLLGVTITASLAYPLSRPTLKCRNVISFLIFFTMLFNGGVVASYLVWTRMFSVKNTIFALIFPNYLITAFNVFLVRNYYSNSIPLEIVEAAFIDGATEIRSFWKVVFPLSKPVITTVALFSGLAYWNDWTNGLYYINEPRLYSIQVYLNNLLSNISMLKSGRIGVTGSMVMNLPSVSIRMAIAVIALIPIAIIFPFIQKSLMEGVVIGGVKG